MKELIALVACAFAATATAQVRIGVTEVSNSSA